jgi:hypothetical protein
LILSYCISCSYTNISSRLVGRALVVVVVVCYFHKTLYRVFVYVNRSYTISIWNLSDPVVVCQYM